MPWVPCLFEKNTREVSRRVARFSFDQLTSLPALDQIALTAGARAHRRGQGTSGER
jgi:hypothetical protein